MLKLSAFKILMAQSLWKNGMTVPQELAYNPLILLLGIYPKELKGGTQIGICIPMFKAALITTVKRQKQPKNVYSKMNKQNVVYSYNRTLFSLKKK